MNLIFEICGSIAWKFSTCRGSLILERAWLAGLPFDILLVALRGLWCHGTAVSDSPNVQVGNPTSLPS